MDKWKSTIKPNLPVTVLNKNQFLLPGFIDCHIHAPQMPNIGLGYDKPLLEWLDSYTFPMEAQYANEAFAADVYEKVIVSVCCFNRLLVRYIAFSIKFREGHCNLERQQHVILQQIMRIAPLYWPRKH